MIIKNFFNESNEGQVFVIIGIVLALSLFMINIGADFDVAFQERGERIRDIEVQVLENIQREIRETYDITVGQSNSNYLLLNRFNNTVNFIDERLGIEKLEAFFIIGTEEEDYIFLNTMDDTVTVNVEQDETTVEVYAGDSIIIEGDIDDEINVEYTDFEREIDFDETYNLDEYEDNFVLFYMILSKDQGYYVHEDYAEIK